MEPAFIAPLVAVFMLAAKGADAARMSRWSKRNVFPSKLALHAQQRGVTRPAQARQSTKRMLTPPLRNGTDQRCVIGGGFLHFYGMVVG